MGIEVALGGSPERVHKALLARDLVRGTNGAPAYLVIDPIAPPRLRSAVASEVAAAFERAVNGVVPTMRSLEYAMQAAANAVERIRAQLVEATLPLDARMGAMMTSDRAIHVALTAGVRLYRARGPMPERMHPKAARPDGLATGRPLYVSEPVEPGEVFILGTRGAFTVAGIGNLASLLARGGRPAVSELCEAMVAPCRDGETGAAVVVMRVGV